MVVTVFVTAGDGVVATADGDIAILGFGRLFCKVTVLL
jgi:hypothetical protein